MKSNDPVRAWLAAEGREDGSADRYLREMFRALPEHAPSPRFTSSVLTRLTSTPARARPTLFVRGWSRGLAMGVVVLGGVLLGLGTFAPVLSRGSIPWLLQVLGAFAGTLGESLLEALVPWVRLSIETWSLLGQFAEALRIAATRPEFLGVLFIITASSILALASLERLLEAAPSRALARRKSSEH